MYNDLHTLLQTYSTYHFLSLSTVAILKVSRNDCLTSVFTVYVKVHCCSYKVPNSKTMIHLFFTNQIFTKKFMANLKNSPANTEATAAIRKDKTTEGPAVSLARCPARTYTPTPRVLPTPSAVRSKVLSTRASRVSVRWLVSSTFFLVSTLQHVTIVVMFSHRYDAKCRVELLWTDKISLD